MLLFDLCQTKKQRRLFLVLISYFLNHLLLEKLYQHLLLRSPLPLINFIVHSLYKLKLWICYSPFSCSQMKQHTKHNAEVACFSIFFVIFLHLSYFYFILYIFTIFVFYHFRILLGIFGLFFILENGKNMQRCWAECLGCSCLQFFWPRLVMRKWLNLSSKESDYSADSDDDADSDAEEG